MQVYLEYAAHVDVALNGWLALFFYSCSNKTKSSEELMGIGTWRDTRRVWEEELRNGVQFNCCDWKQICCWEGECLHDLPRGVLAVNSESK